MGFGTQIAARVAADMLAKRLSDEAKAGKVKPGQGPPKEPDPQINAASNITPRDESAYQAQRAGERMDYAPPEQMGVDPSGGMTNMAFDPNDQLMGASLFGSGQFTAKELKQGYRVLKG